MPSEGVSPPKTFLIILDTGEQFVCAAQEKVLIAMERAAQSGIQVGCRGGGCGACRVEVIAGDYETLRMSKNHVCDEEAGQGFALACRIIPKSDLRLRVAPKVQDQEENKMPSPVAVNS